MNSPRCLEKGREAVHPCGHKAAFLSSMFFFRDCLLQKPAAANSQH
jgi:hypothetical protein